MLLSSNESGRVRHPLIGVATLHCAVTCTPPDDEQRAALFSSGALAQIEEALLSPDGQSGVFRFKAGARVHGEALDEAHVVVEGGKVRAMRKQRCQWLFSRGTLLRYGT